MSAPYSKEGENNGVNGAQLHHSTTQASMLPPHGGAFMPGPYLKTQFRQFANPGPLGLSAFALTTFVLSLVNVNARGIQGAGVVIPIAYAYGGLVQLLAGMWEFAVGNTFGATALSSYGGFWISFAILETGGAQSYGIIASYTTAEATESTLRQLNSALGFYLIGWWIFTTVMLFCTLRSTVAFFTLFFTLDIAFLLLAIAKFQLQGEGTKIHAHTGLNHAGGWFGLIAAFLAWYNALAGLLDGKNSFFAIPVIHFPWSETGKQKRAESAGEDAA